MPIFSRVRRLPWYWRAVLVVILILVALLIYGECWRKRKATPEPVPLKDTAKAEQMDTTFEPKHGIKEP